MLQQRETRQVRTRFNALLSGETIPEEGIALVYVKENGVTVVRKSTGVARRRSPRIATRDAK